MNKCSFSYNGKTKLIETIDIRTSPDLSSYRQACLYDTKEKVILVDGKRFIRYLVKK